MSKTNKFIEMFSGLRTPDRLQKVYIEIENSRNEAKESLKDLPQFQSYLEAEEGLKKLRTRLEELTYRDEHLIKEESTETKLVYKLSGKMMTFTYTRSLPEPSWRRGRIDLGSFKRKAS
tara:strand:+ start:759 stop:1115 length:357 start_codon:yes stop_codon:yes gene_type:complete